MTQKKYRDVSELVRDLSGSDFADSFDEHLAQRRIIKRLTARRAARGLTQQDVAKKLNCTQSRVSKLESSRDDELSIAEIQCYAAVVGLDLTIGFKEQQPAAIEAPRKQRKQTRTARARLAKVPAGSLL